MQFDLFADEALPSIPGLIYQADFLTPDGVICLTMQCCVITMVKNGLVLS